MNYTISKTEILKLAAAREIQTKDAAESHFRETGEQLTPSDARCTREFANVQFVNGSTFDLALPLGKLAKWASLIPAAGERMRFCADGLVHPVMLSDEIAVQILGALKPIPDKPGEYDGINKIRLTCGGSEIAAVCPDSFSLGSGHAMFVRVDLGAAIPVIAPDCGGAFTVQADTSSLKAKRATAAAGKKDAKRRKEFAAARQAEKHCLAELKNGAAAYVAALDASGANSLGLYSTVLEKQKLTLAARRELRRALITPEIMPSWLPETYSQEHRETETVYLLDANGNPKVKEYRQEDFDKAKSAWVETCKVAAGVAEYVGETYVAPVFAPSSYWIESEEVENNWTETVDAHAEFAGYVAAVVTARAALAEYKPRKLTSEARTKYRGYHRRVVPTLLKQDKLALALKAAQGDLESFVRNMFSKSAERNGLPNYIGQTYFTPERNYSRARITARNWPERKGEICTRFIIARDERIAIEPKGVTA